MITNCFSNISLFAINFEINYVQWIYNINNINKKQKIKIQKMCCCCCCWR